MSKVVRTHLIIFGRRSTEKSSAIRQISVPDRVPQKKQKNIQYQVFFALLSSALRLLTAYPVRCIDSQERFYTPVISGQACVDCFLARDSTSLSFTDYFCFVFFLPQSVTTEFQYTCVHNDNKSARALGVRIIVV